MDLPCGVQIEFLPINAIVRVANQSITLLIRYFLISILLTFFELNLPSSNSELVFVTFICHLFLFFYFSISHKVVASTKQLLVLQNFERFLLISFNEIDKF